MFPKGSFGSSLPFRYPTSSKYDNASEQHSQQHLKSRMTELDHLRFTSQHSMSSNHVHLPSSSSSINRNPHSWRMTQQNSDFESNKMTQPEHSNYGQNITKELQEEKKRIRMSSESSQSDAQHLDTLSRKSAPEFGKGKRKRPKFIRKVICQVCGDVANDHMHYGAIACYSCRAFFRRGVKSNAPYFCSQSQSCVINKQSRKHCQYCRFQKCVSIGMKGSWVMTEEDKVEKKEKAIIRRRYNQVKKFKKDPDYDDESYMGVQEMLSSSPPPKVSDENIDRTLDPQMQKSEFYSSYTNTVQSSDTSLKHESQLSKEALSAIPHTSILPSAAATARAVVSDAEHEHQLSQVPKIGNITPVKIEQEDYTNNMEWFSSDSRSFPKQPGSSVANDYEDRSSFSNPDRMLYEESPMDMKPEHGDAEISNGSTNDRTDNLGSNDMVKEYQSDSSESSSRDYSPISEDFSPTPRRPQRNTLPGLLLKNKGKLTFSSNLLNEPVMPFTREENALISTVISTEKETTTQMPISNDTLQAIMHAVKTGSTLSYKATLEGYTVCMKRIIKFATQIDLFREFCAQDQKNLLLSNTDMLVNIRSARMLRPGFNLLDQLSVVYGEKKPFVVPTASKSFGNSGMPIKKRLDYQQIYSSPWASGEDEEQKFFSMMNTLLELQMDHTTTALIAMMALFSQVNYN